MGYPKMDISHWDVAIHNGIKLAQYCDQTRSCNAISRRSPPLCSFALRLRNTKVSLWTHESIGYQKWTSAIGTRQFTMAFSLSNIIIKPDLLTLFHGDCPPLCSFALRLRNTKVPVWTHGSIGYLHMDISHWDAAIHYGIQLAQYCDQTLYFNATLQRSTLCTPLP